MCAWRESAEAGGCVKENQLLRDFSVIVPADDQRRMEVSERPSIWERGGGGGQAGSHRHHSGVSVMARGRRQGQAIHEAEQDKCRRYHEREPVPFTRDGIRGGRAVETHSSHFFCKVWLGSSPCLC